LLSWIPAICCGMKVAAYLSDISGAFDRVSKTYLLAKLFAAGVGTKYLNFLSAYLAPRKGKVVVQGAFSDEISLEDTVFQGTCLGPALWNVFFADVSVPASSTDGREAMFADDLNMFQEFSRSALLPEVMSKMNKCRENVHTWGIKNRVIFDADKEHIIVMHPSDYHGEPFKLLGCMVDLDLRMHTCIDQLLSKIRPKSTAILRTRAYYGTADLLNQYKTHVWCLVEFNCGAYFHASSTLLEKISQVQRSFLTKLGLSEAVAFLDHNFAPTVLRRNIAILGLLHKRVLGLCHPAYDRLLPWWPEESRGDRGAHGHSKQLYDHNQEITHHWSLFNNSIFRMINIYNNLPQHVVDATDVSEFQSILTEKARERCEQGFPQWEMSFSARGGPEVSGISTWI
jgi:hypothetical protein